MTDNKAIQALSFEDALRELETIVRKLEGGSATLDESIADYERGTALRKHCEKKLNEAQSKIEKVLLSKDGHATIEKTQID